MCKAFPVSLLYFDCSDRVVFICRQKGCSGMASIRTPAGEVLLWPGQCMWPPELAVLLTMLFSTFGFPDLRRKHSSSSACLSGSCEPRALCPSMPSSRLYNNVGGDHELLGRQCSVVILMGKKTKQKLVIVRAISVAGLVVGMVLLVSNMFLSILSLALGYQLWDAPLLTSFPHPVLCPQACNLPNAIVLRKCDLH